MARVATQRNQRHLARAPPDRHERPAGLALGSLAPSMGPGGALLIMCLASAGNTAVAVLLGKLVDSVDPARNQGLSPGCAPRDAAGLPGADRPGVPVRESMNVLRRYLVENTCTRINKDMSVRLIAHLMKVDLSILASGPGGCPVRAASTAAPTGSSGSSGSASLISFPPF